MFQTPPNYEVPDLNSIAPGFNPPSMSPANYITDPEIERLREKHRIYDIYESEWNLYLAAYEGGPEMTNPANLWRHPRENEEDFKDRAKRLHYLNYCEQLVDFFTNFIFTETIQRNGGSNKAFYEDFVQDVDRKGSNLQEFMEQVSDDLQIFGHLYILVDTPRVNIGNGQELSKQDEEDLGLRPYWILLRPEEIINWQVDDFENFQYMKRLQIVQQVVNGKTQQYEKYTEFYTDHIQVTWVNMSDPKQPFIERSEDLRNPWGYIPIVIARYRRSKRYPFMGNSFLRDFAYNNREVMNYTSLIQEFLYRQCFNILVKESDSQIPLRDQIDGEWGTANVLEFPKGSAPPAYLSPPADPAEFLQSERARIVSEMFKRAAQDTMNELFNGEKASGFSQSQSFSKTVPFISTRADTLERIEHKLMTITMSMMNKAWDGKIKYKDRYELTNITDAITQLTSLFRDLMFPSETFVKEELKRLVDEVDGKIPHDQRELILKEIDNMDFKQWQEVQKEALVGKGSSPAEQNAPKQTNTIAEAAAESRVNVGATKKLRSPNNKAA